MKRTILIVICTLVFGVLFNVAAQTVQLPRESQRSSIAQTIGDANVVIVYHRPSVKGREVFGSKLVPYGEVWRTGANEATTFETNEAVSINGQPLPAGKYSLHTIPNRDGWTLIFNKVAEQWGSFDYKQDQDALRVKVKPTTGEMREQLTFDFADVKPTSANIVLHWERVKVPFTVDAGDVNGRVLTRVKRAADEAKPDDVAAPLRLASFVVTNKLKNNYAEALQYVDRSIKVRETFGNLSTKARLLAETGDYKNAVNVGERAIQVGKTSTPAANPDAIARFETDLASYRAKK